MRKINFYCIFFSLLLSSLISYSQEDKGLGIKPKETQPKKIVEGNTYAVIVGIDNYQSQKIPKLNYATADAKAFKDFLLSKAGGEVPKENIKMFLNDSASTGKFKKLGLSWINLKAQKGDRVYLYFSGHGITVSGGDSYFLAYNLASDFSVENIEEAGTQALYQLKTNTIRPLHDKGVQVIFIIDACRSHLEDSLRSLTVKTFDPDLNSAEMNAGDIMFLSSSNGQESKETPKDGIKHGVFTYFLLQGLYGLADNGKKTDGQITVNKLKNYVTKMVSDYTDEVQIPRIEYKGSDNPVIAQVDSNSLVELIAKLKTGSSNYDLAINKKTGTSKGLYSSKFSFSDTTGYYDKFFTSLNKGSLWGSEGALYYFNKLEKNNRDSNLLKDAVLNLSSVLVDSGQYIINAYLAADNNVFKGSGNVIERLFTNGSIIFDTLYRISNKYFPKDNDNIEYLQQYYFMKGRSLAQSDRKKDNNQALDFLNKAYRLDTSDVYILHAIGLVLIDQGAYGPALENQKKVIERYPDWSFAYNLMGRILLGLNNHKEALLYHNKALQLDSTNGSTWNNMGVVYESLKEYDKAIEAYQKAILLDPKDHYPPNNIGDVYMELRDYGKAIQYYQDALAVDTGYADSWIDLALGYKKLKEKDKAMEYLKRSLSIDPAYSRTWNELGNMYLDVYDSYDSSIYYYRQAEFLDSSLDFYTSNIGLAYSLLSKHDSALFYYWKAVKKPGSDTSDLVYRLERIYRYETHDTAGLINLYNWTISTNQKDGSKWSKLGETYAWAGDNRNAELAYAKAYAVEPAKKYLYAIVNVKAEGDKTLEKIEVLSKLLDLDPDSDKALVEYGWYLGRGEYYYMDSYNETIIDKLKAKKDFTHIANYLRTYIEFDKNKAESWFKLAEEYRQYELAKDSVIYFYKTSIRLDSAVNRFNAWPELCNLLNQPSFTAKAIQYLENKRKAGPGTYMLFYNLARCYYYANNYRKAVELVKYAQKNFDILKQNREEFIKIPDELYNKIWERD